MRPSLQILDDELIDRIVDEAMRVLAEVGMEIRGKEMRRRLLDHGLPTNATGERVLFPRDVVEAAIASAPSSFWLYDRDGAPHADIGGDRVHFVPGLVGPQGARPPDRRDAAREFDRLRRIRPRSRDGLANIPYLATAFSTNDDIEAGVSDAWRLYMTLTNSKKPVVSGAFTEHGVPRMVEMMQLFRADRADLIARPMSIFTITATGNFRYSEDSCQNLIDCVEAGIAVEIVPVTLMGLIAPVTVVGATVFHTADVLAGITMAQIVRPGAPVLFGGAPATFHMKIASSPMSAIEALQLDAAYVAVAKKLGLPTQSYMALSDGPILDAQAGAETFGSALIAALAGVNSVSGPGMLDFLLVFSLPKLVFDDEMCGQALRFVREVVPARRPAGQRPRRPADGRPAPDHGRPHDRPLADRALPAERDRRSRQPRGVDEAGLEGHLPARLRRGRPPAGGLSPARDRPRHRCRAAPDHPVRTDRPRARPARDPHRPRTRRARCRGRGTSSQPPPRGRRPPRTPGGSRHMTTPLATPATEASSTLYFGPWYRRSPFFEKTLEAGCSAYDIYNHMYLPGYYADPIEEYWALLNGVTVWDVSVERIVEITGPDATAFTNMLTCRDLTKCAVGQGKYMIVTAEDGGIVNDPVLLRIEENRWWMALADSDAGLWARGVATHAGMDVKVREPEVYPVQVQGPKSRDVMRTIFGPAIDDIKYYWTLTTEVDGIPVVISRTGWTGEVGYEVYLRDPSRGGDLWDRLMEAGKPHDIRPIAPCEARRIEAGIFNYNSDMTINDTPFHVMGLERLVETQDADYIGKAALEEIRAERRRSQAGRHRGRRRRAAVRAVAQVRRAVERQGGRDRHRPHLVAAAREEHRLRLGPDRARRSRQRRSRSSRPTAASGRRRPRRSRSSTRRRPCRSADRMRRRP